MNFFLQLKRFLLRLRLFDDSPEQWRYFYFDTEISFGWLRNIRIAYCLDERAKRRDWLIEYLSWRLELYYFKEYDGENVSLQRKYKWTRYKM